MKAYKIIIVLSLLLVFSCKRDEIFEESPAERIAKSVDSLRNELCNVENAWFVTYFPKIDSLLFTNTSEHIEEYHQSRFGLGGYAYIMKFNKDGVVSMLADTDQASAKTFKESEYEIKLAAFTQLSFTSYNYIHALSNSQKEGTSDFLFHLKNLDKQLVFKSPRNIDPSKEYIVFEPIKAGEKLEDLMEQARQNRLFFQEMKNPQIIIKRESRIFFLSDMVTRTDFIRDLVNEAADKRYHLFLFAKDPYSIGQNKWPKKVEGLGSGYVGTYKGISFRTGIRLNKNFQFFDFERVGDKFVCELVQIYDPYERKIKWVSRHLHPEGEITGVVAEIWDAK